MPEIIALCVLWNSAVLQKNYEIDETAVPRSYACRKSGRYTSRLKSLSVFDALFDKSDPNDLLYGKFVVNLLKEMEIFSEYILTNDRSLDKHGTSLNFSEVRIKPNDRSN